MKNENTSVTPVRYYVGDLCYVMHDVWEEVCDLIPYDNSEHDFELEDGRKFILFNTAYGDGTYNDLNGRPYSVDSGTIGAIKLSDILDPGSEDIITAGLGHVHEFPAEINGFDCYYDKGVINIYSVSIETAPEWDSEYEED